MKLYFSIIILLLITLQIQVMADQISFLTPEKAATELYQAIEKNESAIIKKLFGTKNIRLLPLDEIDDKDAKAFISEWRKSYKLTTKDKEIYYVEIGDNAWTFPVPIIKSADGWIFDTITGAENVLMRRIGRNELNTMQTMLAYYDAQLEYAEQDRNNDGILEYAQKFRSSADKKDGLYWEVKAAEEQSPLGTLLANRTADDAYHGYYYKILSSQGSHGVGGAYNYLINHRMVSGFALVAWPAEYGNSGVMTFIINHSGVIYEKNLGPEAQKKGTIISQFDPDSSWSRVE